jgi:hypothetical protein
MGINREYRMRKLILYIISFLLLSTTLNGQTGVIGIFASSTTTTTPTYGSELITNGTFNSTATGWPISATSWAWQTDGAGGGWLRHTTSAGDELLYQNILAIGTIYHISITVGGMTDGNLNITCGHDYTYTVVISGNGSYTYDLECIGDDTYFRIEGVAVFDGYIDNISVKEVL